MPLHDYLPRDAASDTLSVLPQFAKPGEARQVPRYRIPEDEMAPDTAYQIVHDELLLDGNARQNLASFATTWMDPQARRLMDECVNKNLADRDEYPQMAELESRCVRIVASLCRASCCTWTGSCASTVGSCCAIRRSTRSD